MKIQILSDLHLEVAPLVVDDMNADVVVLAGDIDIGVKAIQWAKEHFKQPVIFVLGNHEYWYGNAMSETLREMQSEAVGSNVFILDCDSYELEGVRFLGTTLWTDLLKNPFSGVECGVINRDRENIQVWEAQSFLDDYAQSLFEQNKTWLKSKLDEPFDGQTVVITHHAPSGQSQHEQYEGNPYASCFITDMEDLMGKNVNLWIHGHTHNNFDYNLNGTRVVCNPRGYPRAFGGFENQTFKPRLVVGLGEPDLTDLDIPVREKNGLKYVRISDLPKKYQASFESFLYGSAAPCIEGEARNNTAWPWDYQVWLNGQVSGEA